MIKDLLEEVSGLDELNSMSDYLQDETLDECFEKIIRLISRVDTLTPATASRLVVQLAAMSLKFKMVGKYYMVYDKESDPGGKKKNTYLSLSEGLDKLVDSLKYLAKSN